MTEVSLSLNACTLPVAEVDVALATTPVGYASDPKYKKYTQQVEKCLSSFDNVHEWADFISFLKQLLKVRVHSVSRVETETHHTCIITDFSVVSTIQGDPPETGCSQTVISMLESCVTEWSTPEGIGRVLAYFRCSWGASHSPHVYEVRH